MTSLSFEPLRWMRRAACAESDPELFDVPDLDKPAGRAAMDLRDAAELCAECPVRLTCALYAHDERLVGVWGGTLFGVGHPIDLVANRENLTGWRDLRRRLRDRQRDRATYRNRVDSEWFKVALDDQIQAAIRRAENGGDAA